MKQFKFKFTVGSSAIFVLSRIRKARRYIAETDKYTDEDRFNFACEIIDHMRKRSLTTTLVYGKENLPADGGYILYSNHQGKYDALGILLNHPGPCRVLWERRAATKFLAKECCGLLGGQTIDFEDIKDSIKVLRIITEQVKEGKRFLIFPEGRYDGNKNEMLDFKTGCFYCSLNSKAPMIPVAIYDSYKAMDTNNIFKKVTTEVHFLKPIYFEEYGEMTKSEIADLIKSRIGEKLAERKAEKEKARLEKGKNK